VRSDRLRNDEVILRVAARLLSRDPGATVQAIADAAGLARPTVYRRYPDREALITGLRTQVEEELWQALEDLPPWSAGVHAMVGLVQALVGVASRYPVAMLRYDPVPGSPEAVDAQIAGILAAGQRAGVLRSDISAEMLNAAMFGVLSAVLDGAPAGDLDSAAGNARAASSASAHAAATVLSLLLPGFLVP